MKPFTRLFPLIVLLGACATAVGPAPAPTQPVQPPRAAPVVPARVTVMPERWWLLDVETDGVYGAGIDRAYREVLNAKQPRRSVVVAIIDSGIDIAHEDLDGMLWSNARETRNSRDDDGNSYIDDVSGWNFIGGRDGRHVDQDTYEVTRLYAACEALYGSRPRTPLPVERVTQQECTEITADFSDRRDENGQMLAQVQQIETVVNNAVRILKEQLGTDSLTEARVRLLTPVRTDVRQAREIFLSLAQQGITPDMVADEVKRIDDLLRYGLNPDFDPRPIVGDNYADPTERGYGNADVTGPDASHGTGVAGIVAARRNNGIGVDGIAVNVQIMTIRAVPDGDERDKDVANAIRYAVDQGAHIINMSFGKAYSPQKSVVDAAVKYADERGVLLVHAAGNEAKDLATENNYPNRYYADGGAARNWIEVGASNWGGRERLAADFSNYGAAQVDVFAPGTDIRSTAPANSYESASGTSFAAPVVSGIAALLMVYYPELTASDVRRIIVESAVPVRDQLVLVPGEEQRQIRFGALSVTGAIVNAYRAVRMAEELSRR
ncbi:MAG TPA: S8 family peptidase [Longimicrobiales bacterium]|nr:S8 family peptidase [Longimicrobiales bacterium]